MRTLNSNSSSFVCPFRVTVCLLGVAFVLVGLTTPAAAESPRPLLRFPDIHSNTVVFVHAEDVWTAPAAGGAALRLTDDPGEDRHPKLSPDGTLIAWTSEQGGNPDVWVMRADGSEPRRLTWHPGLDEVVGWHPTSGKVLFRSDRVSYARFNRLFLVAPDGSGLEQVPLHEAGRGAFSPDGQLIAYNRIAREDRTWKRYRGGMAQDVWLYDVTEATDVRLTDFEGTDRLPMWIDGEIWFASDRDGRLNLWAMAPDGGALRQVTRSADWDLRRPSSGDGRHVVYERGGDLWVYDSAAGEERRIDVTIPTPASETRPYLRSVAEDITHVDIAPEGGRAVIAARGEIFTVPAEHGPTRNLTRTPGARYRGPKWSPDGSRIAFWSDADGEVDLWLVAPGGGEVPGRLTDLGRGYRHTVRWSPDSAKIAFADQTLSVSVVDVASGEVTVIDTSEAEPMDVSLEEKPISDFAWSPDSRYLAYSKMGPDMVFRVWVHDLQDGVSRTVSTGQFNDFGPVFTRDGRHLVFVSNRRFDPTFCDFEWEMVYKNVAGLYAVTLAGDGEALLPPRSDEAAPADVESGGEADVEEEQVAVRIDWDGIEGRIEALPVPASNYRELAVADGKILFLDAEEGDFNAFEFRAKPPRTLAAFDLEQREVTELRSGVDGYAPASDGRHVVWWAGEQIGILADRPSGVPAELMARMGGDTADENGLLDLSGLEMRVDPVAEWRQVYDEAWRMERDFFYTPTMHGLDWVAVGAKFRALVDRATCAQDLRFIIGELIGELSTSHTYVGAGTRRREAADVEVGMLGADWRAADGRWRIETIYRVPDWTRGIDPPLAGPGVDVAEGDYLLAVNGHEVTDDREVYSWFQGLADEPVELLVNDRSTADGARTVTVTPLRSERMLRYHDWVEHNRRVVDEASDGKIGYLHLPDTYMGSAVEFPKGYYPQTMKQGLIVDGRYNGGGLDPDIFLARLAKEPLSYWTRRYSLDHQTPWPCSAAHMVCLTNRQAGSGGDELPFEFREKGMGPVIGTRTWGGLVGVSMFLELMDGSFLTAPDYRVYTVDGEWTVENEGVQPDIVVELDPAEMARGWDAQLQKGIEVLLAKIEADPVTRPEPPPVPTLVE